MELEVWKKENFEESDVEELPPEELEGIRDDAPHLVFLISGIRTNGLWAQEARDQELLWDGREVLFVPVRGNCSSEERLSTWHLLSRLGLGGFRNSFKNQIKEVSSKTEYASINVFAHSMGSAIFADIVESLVKEIPKKKFDTIVFLGSVCHRRHGQSIYNCSHFFVNDVGIKDYWPYFASIARPGSYSDVGFAGFLNAYARDRFFSHDHTTCTSVEHIRNELIPLISTSEVKSLGIRRTNPTGYNRFVYFRKTVWVLVIAIFAFLGVALVF